MEGGIRSQAYNSIRSYWRRRTYQRLEGLPLPSKRMRVSRLGGGSRTGRRSSNVRPVLRMVREKICSPIRLLARLKDNYVDAMLALAGGEARPSALHKRVLGGQDASWERRMPKARQMSARRGNFEQRMMLHIYRSLVAPPEVIGCSRDLL